MFSCFSEGGGAVLGKYRNETKSMRGVGRRKVLVWWEGKKMGRDYCLSFFEVLEGFAVCRLLVSFGEA